MRNNADKSPPASVYSLIRTKVLFLFVVLWAALVAPALAHSCSGIPDAECDALYALYYSTGGDHWADNTNWLSDEPVWNWHGVIFGAGHVMGIDLHYNNLTGSIPAEVSNLPNLWSLGLWGNSLTGSIPVELVSLTNLQSLLLSNNNLTGSIPAELGGMNNLIQLSLGGNKLSGEIPPAIGDLAGLQLLTLASNSITGPIPPELGNLSELHHLSLYENKLSGVIPPELGKLTTLSTFNIHSNHLTGPIPPELCNLTSLGDLNLSRNKLTGEIPPELGSMTWLHSLNLSFNNLTGPIPAELGNLTDLGTFHLNSNNLSGALPAFLGITPSPYGWINLSWNRLYTSDPAILWVLETMEDTYSSMFRATQTLPPISIQAATIENLGIPENRVLVSWKPITYVDDGGGYQVFYQKEGGPDFHYGGMTPDKETTSLIVSNLEPGVDYTFRVNTVTWKHGYNGNDLYSEDSNTTSAVSGSLNRAFIPVWKQSPQYFTGVVVSNFGDEDFDLTLTAWDSSGHKEPLGQNPAVYTVGAGLQKSLLGWELFQADPTHHDFSWIELGVENSRDLGSIFLFGVNDTQMLDGAEAQYRYAKKLYFTRPLDEKFFEGWDPDIQMCIVNPTDQEVRIVCWIKGSSRDFGQSHLIPPRGFVTGNAKELVPLYYDVTNGYMEIEVTDGPGVIGFSRVEFPGVQTALGLNAVEASLSEKIYSAQLAHGANIVTNLQLVNTNEGLRNIKLTPIADDGSTLAAPVWIAIPGERIYNTDLGTLFGLESNGDITTGSLIVESFGKGVIGDIIFAEGETMEYAMSLPLQEDLFQEAVFNHISNLPTVFTGFAFFNPGDETVEVTIEAVGIDGDVVAGKILILGPGERIARTLTDPDIWPEFEEQSGGYIRIQSTQPIAGQQLFGDRSLRYMAAIPPTTRVEPMFN